MQILTKVNNFFMRNLEEKNELDSITFKGKTWTEAKRLGEERITEGYLMRVDLYRVKRKTGRRTEKGFAVISEMRTGKKEWHYWVEDVLKERAAAEILLEDKLRKASGRFGVLDQYESYLSNKMQNE